MKLLVWRDHAQVSFLSALVKLKRTFFKKSDNNPALILSETSPSWVEGKATEAEEIEDGEENKEQQIICLMSPEQKYVWAIRDWSKSTGGWSGRSIWKCGVLKTHGPPHPALYFLTSP